MTERSTRRADKPTPQTRSETTISLSAGVSPLIDPLVPTVFHEPWWLNAATGGSFEQVQFSDGHQVIGRFPYAVWQRYGRTISTLPPFTHILGPAINEGSGTDNTRFLKRYTVTRELIARLPKTHRFRQKLHSGYPEVLSFQAEGFRTGVQFTFEVEPQTENDAWNKLRNKTRNVIRRAQERLDVSDIRDPAEFIRLYEGNLALRGSHMNEPREAFAAVCTAALEKQAGRVLCAKDKNGSPVAAIFVVFDATAGYYLLTTRSTNSGNGAVSLLIWNAIRFCGERNLRFNFDGIGAEGAILLYAGFGGQPKPIYIVTRDSKRIKVIDSVRTITGLFSKQTFFDR